MEKEKHFPVAWNIIANDSEDTQLKDNAESESP